MREISEKRFLHEPSAKAGGYQQPRRAVGFSPISMIGFSGIRV
jgi:hypothetical protein